MHEGKNRLFKHGNLVVRRIDDFYLALSPDLPNIMVMDDFGKRFFELCDGCLTADDIIEQILKEHKVEVSRGELVSFVSSLLDAKFLLLKSPESLQKVERSLEKLGRLYFHVTRGCNLRCKHCYVEAGEPLEGELTTLEAVKLTEDFAQLGGEMLVISGGEPFLRKRTLYEVFRRARESGIGRIFVETNGTLISDVDVDICRKYGVELGVSLDGAVPETNDSIRGAGSYRKTVGAVRKLAGAGVRLRIAMTLMRPNVEEAERMILLAKDLDVESMAFKVVRGLGRAGSSRDLLLSLKKMHSVILSSWRKAEEVGVATQLEDQFQSFARLTRTDSCGAGTDVLLVSSNGDVYPCNMFLGLPEFRAGNIREQRLEDVWRNSEALKVLRRLSVLDIEGCRDCELKFICRFCPGEIFLEHGNFNKKPSFCPLYKGLSWMLIEELARRMWKEQSACT